MKKGLTIRLPFRFFAHKTDAMKLRNFLVAFILALTVISNSFAQSTATQTLTLEVKPITKIAVSGNPNPMVISDATPGSDLASVRDDNTRYSVTTNLDNMKIVASINDPMPAGTRLMITLESLRGTSRGTVDLSSAVSPVDVVTGIGKGSEVSQPISYVFAANADVPEFAGKSRVITLTVTN